MAQQRQPDQLSLSSVDRQLFLRFEDHYVANTDIKLLQESTSRYGVRNWCSKGAQSRLHKRDMRRFGTVIEGPAELTGLKLFKHRDKIVETIKSARVTILLAPTGSGKTDLGPLLHCLLLRSTGPHTSKDHSVSYRGLTVLPTSDNVKSMARQCEKMMMTRLENFCDIYNFANPFARIQRTMEKDSPVRLYSSKHVGNPPEFAITFPPKFYPPEFAITTHRGARIALSGKAPHLKTLIIDEVHSTKPDIAELLACARKLMLDGDLEKLILSTASLDEEEIKILKRYFPKCLSVDVVNLHSELRDSKNLVMSCARLTKGQARGVFTATDLSKALTKDFEEGKENVYPPNEHEDSLRPFGYEEEEDVPEMNHMLPYVKRALHQAMVEAWKWLQQGHLGNQMPSVLILLPGKEHVERIRSCVERALFESNKNPHHFSSLKCQKGQKGVLGQPAFLLKNRKSKKNPTDEEKKEAAHDDYILEHPKPLVQGGIERHTMMSEHEKQRRLLLLKLLREPKGSWGGDKGNIIFATPQAAESMTIKNVAVVIDAGVMRIPAEYTRCGLRSLELTWIDKRMLEQRAGRCGRMSPESPSQPPAEYFLCVTSEKAARIMSGETRSSNTERISIKELMRRREFDEEAFFRAKLLGCFDDLIWKPPVEMQNLFLKSFSIRGLWRGGFTSEAKLLFEYFYFLPAEIARFVVMGVRLGLAAHTICYAAEATVSKKLCSRPTKIDKNKWTISDEAVYELFVNVSAAMPMSLNDEEVVRPYDMSDSVALADLVTTWFRHTFPKKDSKDEEDPTEKDEETMYNRYKQYTKDKWEKMEKNAAAAPDGRFWAGRWCVEKPDEENKDKKGDSLGMEMLQQMIIREDGCEDVTDRVHQITHACQRLGIIGGDILSPDFNKYRRGEDNYNLNGDGRALFRAILTINSDKLARAQSDRFTIADGAACLFPARSDWKQRIDPTKKELTNEEDKKMCTAKYVRYWSAFKATHAKEFVGMCDQLTTEQVAFFMNLSGRIGWNEKDGMKIWLNASPEGDDGIMIKMGSEEKRLISKVRNSLLASTARLLREEGEETFDKISNSIISLWNALDNDYEVGIQMTEEWKEECKPMELELPAVPRDMLVNEVIPPEVDKENWGGW